MSQDIEQRVIELAAEQAGVEPAQVTIQHHFVNDLNFDSLDKVEFAMKVEDEFEVHVPDEELEAVQTVGDATELVKRALAASGVGG
jgi:acyl carrier protein